MSRDNPRAFPLSTTNPGMTLRDYFAGQALANPVICTGKAEEYQLERWFGGRGGITAAEIVAKQAATYADAMLSERSKATGEAK